MSYQQFKKVMLLTIVSLVCFGLGTVAYAAASGTLGAVASNVTLSLSNIAKLITGGAYVAGLGFAVGAIVKFKAHKENPTQVPISQPIVFLFVGVALIFAPSVFKTSATTMGFKESGIGAASGLTI